MSDRKTVHGRCHCGAIEFEADVDPQRVVVCHCTDCQVMSGSAFRAVVFSVPDAFRLKSGHPKTYVKTAQSGNKRAQVFCGDCGAALYATAVEDGPKVYGIRTGVLCRHFSLHFDE